LKFYFLLIVFGVYVVLQGKIVGPAKSPEERPVELLVASGKDGLMVDEATFL